WRAARTGFQVQVATDGLQAGRVDEVGGLDVAGQEARIKAAVERLAKIGCEVSLFIDADERQIAASKRVGAPAVELHTGRYADAQTPTEVAEELQR
ncbi:hypothetical protein APX70_05613, partial [Pseudomonas syringae pv. maculicola]